MALSDDEKRLLEELTAKANAPDDFEIEVYDTQAGKGARIPFSQGKNWLFSTFGIGEAPATASSPGEGGGENAGTGGGAPPAGTSGHFFGRNQGAGKKP